MKITLSTTQNNRELTKKKKLKLKLTNVATRGVTVVTLIRPPLCYFLELLVPNLQYSKKSMIL